MKMKKLLHGALALALTVALIVSSLVFAQAAAVPVVNVGTAAELASAVTNSATNTIINITADITDAETINYKSKKLFFTGDHTVTFKNDGFVANTGSFAQIDGPTFVQGSNNRALVVYQATVVVHSGGCNGYINVQSGNSTNPSKLYINGGTFTQPSGNNLINAAGSTTVVLNGGNFVGADANNTLVWSRGTLTINGGDYKALNSSKMVSTDTGTIKVQGGTFNYSPNYVSSPYAITQSGGKYEVAAHVTDSSTFTTAVGRGGTIYVDANVTSSKIAAAGIGLNFKGNGTVTFSGDGLVLTSYSHATIDGPTFVSSSNTAVGSVRTIVIWDASCIINNTTGTTAVTGFIDNQGGDSALGKLVINGGTFTQKNANLLRGNNWKTRNIINGGTFNGNGTTAMISWSSDTETTITGGANGPVFNKASGQTGIENSAVLKISGGKYNFDPSNLGIVSGYEATLSNGIYTVDVLSQTKKQVDTIDELLDAIEKNIPEIEIIGDITYDKRIGGLYNKTITFTGSGSLTFTGTTDGTSGFHIYGGCNIVFDGPTFQVGNTAGRLMTLWDGSNPVNVTFESGTFKGEIQVQDKATAVVNGGTFLEKSDNTYTDVFEVRGSGDLTINDGEFTTARYGHIVNVASVNAKVDVNGGEFNSTGTNDGSGYAFYNSELGVSNFTVSGATINLTNKGNAFGVGDEKAITVKDVTVNNNGTGMVATFVDNDAKKGYGTLNIEGGTYNASVATFVDAEMVEQLNITGGKYNFDPSSLLDETSAAKDNGDGTWSVSLVKVIVDDFAALKEAIDKNIPEIEINKDIQGDTISAITNKNITFTGEGSVTFTSDGFYIASGCNIVFNGPDFKIGNTSKRVLIAYANGNEPVYVTINDGEFIGEIQTQYKTTLTINGGTFNAKDGSSFKDLVKLTTGDAIIINGGTFNATVNGGNAVVVDHMNATGYINVMGGEFNASNGATAFYVNTTTANSHSISNAEINVQSGSTAINVSTGKTVTLKRVTVTNAGTFKSGAGTLKVVSGTYNFDPASYVDANVSDTKTADGLYIVTRKTGTPKMLRLTNGYNMNFSGYNFAAEATITAGQTYIFEIDYREFGGAGGLMFDLCYATTANGYNNGANKITPSEIDAVDGRYYRIEFTAPQGLRASNNFRLRIGQETLQLGTKDANGTLTNTYNYSTTIYVANVKLVNVNDTAENLIENGDFGYTPVGNITKDTTIEGWALYGIDNLTSVDVINIPNGFFTVDDLADLIDLSDTNKDYAIKLQGGDRHEIQFKVNFKPDTYYQFSYYYRATDDLPEFLISTDFTNQKINDISTEYIESGYYKKTYKIYSGTLGNEKGARNRFCFRMGHNSDDVIFYITKVQLFELDGENINSKNIIGDYNPVFIDAYDFTQDNFDKEQMSQSDNLAMKNIVAHGWLGLFNKNADNADNDTGSDDYSGVAKVDAGFFAYTSATANSRDGIFGKLPYDSIYDVYDDDKYDVLDILIAKMEYLGFYGADFQTEILKNEIVNAKDDASIQQGKNIVKVAATDNDSTLRSRITNASSGTTVLLERGGKWRISSTINIPSGVNLGAYGTGEKPRIYGSTENSGGSWTSQGNNIYRIYRSADYGNVYLFKKGNENNTKPDIIGCKLKDGALLTSTDQLTEPGDNYQSGNYLYVRLEDGKKPSDYGRIEISGSVSVIEASQNTTIDNISIYYAGRHGITTRSGSSNVTVQNCEIGYTGGSWNDTAPCGNAIEFGVSGTNLKARYNYIYQSYDTGITFQNWETSGVFNGVTLEYNLLTNNFYNIEWWTDNLSANAIQNVVIQNNILKDAGYCWSITQRHAAGNDANFASNIYSGKETTSLDGRIKNVSIINNIFDHTRGAHICWAWNSEDDSATEPDREQFKASGNVFYQETGSPQQSVQRFGQLDNGAFAFASSQGKFEETMKVFDTTAFARWVVTTKKKITNYDYKDVTIGGLDVSNYVIVNETKSNTAAYLVYDIINVVTGKKLAVSNSASSNAIKIVNDMALAPNTVKVYVEDSILYIASYDTNFIYKSIAEFEKLLGSGELAFANGYEKVITLPAISYEDVSGTKKLIGDSDKNAVGYSVGETATVNIAAYANGNILSVPYFRVKTYNESTKASTDQYVSGESGVYQLKITPSEAGFVYWSVTACDSNKKVITSFSKVDTVDSLDLHYSGSVGFNVSEIGISAAKPNDFETKWATVATEVKNTSIASAEITEVSTKAGYKTFLVKLPYNEAGFATGYLTYPTNATAGSLGLKVTFQSNSVAVPDKMYEANTAVFRVCAHSLDIATALSDANYLNTFKAKINAKGNFAWDNTSFNDSYLVNMVKRDLLASKFLIEHFGASGNKLWDGKTFIAMGTSMGGFQAIAVAALLEDVTRTNVTGTNVTTLDVSLPWLCDLNAGNSNNRKKSSWRPAYGEVTKYVDPVHFATMLGNVDEIIVNAGLGDAICPASGVMAFYNTINNNNKTISFRQNNTHSGGYDGKYFTITNKQS